MSRVKLSINEKNVFLFSHDLSTSPITVDSDSDFISKRVTEKDPAPNTYRDSGHLDNPKPETCGFVAEKISLREWAQPQLVGEKRSFPRATRVKG